jgi:hypothetical protein
VDSTAREAPQGVPIVVRQALDDVQLPPSARLMMWHVQAWLDFHEYRALKGITLAHEMRIRETTASKALSLLVDRGYLDESADGGRGGRARAFRLPFSRRRARAGSLAV